MVLDKDNIGSLRGAAPGGPGFIEPRANSTFDDRDWTELVLDVIWKPELCEILTDDYDLDLISNRLLLQPSKCVIRFDKSIKRRKDGREFLFAHVFAV